MNRITIKVTRNGCDHPGKAYTVSIQVETPITECDTWEEAYDQAQHLAGKEAANHGKEVTLSL